MSDAWSPPETPSAVPAANAVPQSLGATRELLSESWRLLRANPWPVVGGLVCGLLTIFGVSAGFTAVMSACMLVSQSLGQQASDGAATLLPSLLVLLGYPVVLMLMLPAQGVMLRGGLMTVRGQPLEGATLVRGVGRMATTGAVMTVVMILALIPAMLLLYIPAVYLGLRWSTAFFNLIDSDLSALDCLRASWRETEGKVWDLLVKNIAFAALATIGLLGTCYLGLIVIAPLQLTFAALVYARLSGRVATPARVPRA